MAGGASRPLLHAMSEPPFYFEGEALASGEDIAPMLPIPLFFLP